MARDPLATAGVVMIDQARSIRDQLRAVKPARVALARLSEDADALAARVDGALVRAEGALVAATREGRAQSRDTSKALTAETARWLSALDACLRIGEASDAPAVQMACAQVRAVVPRERRSFVGAQRTAAAVMPLLHQHALTLQGVPGIAIVTERGMSVKTRLDAHQLLLNEESAALTVAVALARKLRLVLLATLREVRRLWTAASRIAPEPLPALDLRIGKSAVAAARRPSSAPDDAGEPTTEGGVAPSESALPLVEAAASPVPDAADCAGAKVLAQVVVAVT